MHLKFPVNLLIHTPEGLLPLTEERSLLPLPRGPESEGPLISYGPYMKALARFLSQDSYAPLMEALSLNLRRSVALEDVRKLDIISEKHGALYNVLHLVVAMAEGTSSLAVNVAATVEQQEVLNREYNLLCLLHENFHHPYIPRPYFRGEVFYDEGKDDRKSLRLFIAEWFEEFHEFHLSRQGAGEDLKVRVWDPKGPGSILSAEESLALYRQAAAILTSYLDGETFKQIYPWHHAAGDFVLRRKDGNVELRLITARDYRPLGPSGLDPNEKWLAIVHFFFNLTLRMRIDRLDGTGELAWAKPQSLKGIIAGFLEAWDEKHRKTPSLPTCPEVLDLIGRFTPEEWLPLGEIVLEDGLLEKDEYPFIRNHLENHILSLVSALQDERVAAGVK